MSTCTARGTLTAVLDASRYRALSEGREPPQASATKWTRRRALCRSPETRQVTGIRWEECDRMVEACQADGSPQALRDAALFAVLSAGLLRVSEAFAVEARDVRPVQHGAVLHFRRSKTDQAGEGAYQYIGPPTFEALRAFQEVRNRIRVTSNPHRLHAIAGRSDAFLVDLQFAGRWGSSTRPSHYA